MRPTEIDARGTPFYHLADLKPIVTQGQGPRYYFRDGSYSINISPPAPDGAQYAVFNIGAGQSRSFWDRATYSRIARMQDGKIQWIAGRHDGRKIHDGEFTYAWRALGQADGVVVIGDVDFQLIAYTSDGFCLGGLAPVGYKQLTPEAIVQENVQGAQFFRDPKTGKPLVVIGSGTEVLVLEVTGIGAGQIERQQGEIRLDTARPRALQTPDKIEIPYQTWPAADNGRYQGINAEDYEWSETIPDLAIRDDAGTLIGSVRLRRDAGFLEVYASVIDPTPVPDAPADAADSWRKLDGLELLLGPDKPGQNAAGTRIFLTGKRGADDANGQPTWSGVALMQRLGQDAQLQPLPDAKVAIRKSLNGYGYHLEAEIPLALFPQISRQREVTFIRNDFQPKTKVDDWNETYTQNRPDLPDAFRLDVALWRDQKRFSWMKLDETAALDPARWGVANANPRP